MQNAITVSTNTNAKIGNKLRTREMPKLLMAVISKCSPKFPNVINEESNTPNGNATGDMKMAK
jgi:hypothetical protein